MPAAGSTYWNLSYGLEAGKDAGIADPATTSPYATNFVRREDNKR